MSEGEAVDAGHATSDGDGGQAAATTEGRIADACHAIGDGDGGQAAAILEGRATDGFDTISDIICFYLVTKYGVEPFITLVVRCRNYGITIQCDRG